MSRSSSLPLQKNKKKENMSISLPDTWEEFIECTEEAPIACNLTVGCNGTLSKDGASGGTYRFKCRGTKPSSSMKIGCGRTCTAQAVWFLMQGQHEQQPTQEVVNHFQTIYASQKSQISVNNASKSLIQSKSLAKSDDSVYAHVVESKTGVDLHNQQTEELIAIIHDMQNKIDIMEKQIEALETAQLEAKKRTNKISAPTYAEVAAIDKSNRTKTNQRDKISNIITTSVEAAGEVGTKARLQKIGELLTKGHYPTEIRRPMAKRLLPAASAIENPALADAISKTKAVYITGIQRQRISNIRTLLRLAGKFGAKEVLNISFVGRHITSFLCGSADIANNLKESIQSWPKIKVMTDFSFLDFSKLSGEVTICA